MIPTYVSPPKAARLNREQLAILLNMSEEQFADFVLQLERMRYTVARWKTREYEAEQARAA